MHAARLWLPDLALRRRPSDLEVWNFGCASRPYLPRFPRSFTSNRILQSLDARFTPHDTESLLCMLPWFSEAIPRQNIKYLLAKLTADRNNPTSFSEMPGNVLCLRFWSLCKGFLRSEAYQLWQWIRVVACVSHFQPPAALEHKIIWSNKNSKLSVPYHRARITHHARRSRFTS